ncbi:uncharacterized protein EDB93DRAFT_1245775 [Suillus bovinus]|uniref:uncharacterized protein n=1 Tax=Suillus bovinus TaxID=48563 RepID=UPI001B864244|nr:uncharacterized protein EDB93DRAFT_1245775 [Suillus bovinus]KAG2158544.1 hypothetical protein EDB93DRAFT_1245775 [Suillus bovinus]
MSSSNDTSSFRHYIPPAVAPLSQNSTQPSLLLQPLDSLSIPPPPKLSLPPPKLPLPPPSPPMSLEVLPVPLSFPESSELLLAPIVAMPPSPVMHVVTASALVSVPDTSHNDCGQVVPTVESEDLEWVKERPEVDAKWDTTHKHLWANWTTCLDD